MIVLRYISLFQKYFGISWHITLWYTHTHTHTHTHIYTW